MRLPDARYFPMLAAIMKNNTRPIAYIAFLAFLMNVMVPFFAVYNVQDTQNNHGTAKEMASLFGEKILICTGDGFKWVKLADLESGKEKPKPHPDYKCPLCYIAAHAFKYLFLLAAVFLIFPRRKSESRRRVVFDYRPPAFYLQSLLGSRAPPASFSF